MQFKNDDDLHADMQKQAVLDPMCDNLSDYVKVKLGSRQVDYHTELKNEILSNEKRAYKSNEQSRKGLDCMAL